MVVLGGVEAEDRRVTCYYLIRVIVCTVVPSPAPIRLICCDRSASDVVLRFVLSPVSLPVSVVLVSVMTSAQLAIFKIPAVDNEPMVNSFSFSRAFCANRCHSEATVRALQNERASKRL